MVAFYWRRMALRAWRDRLHVFGFQSVGKAVLQVLLFVVACLLLWRLGEMSAVVEYMRYVLAVMGATTLLFVPVYLWKFVSAPAKSEVELTAASQRVIDELTRQRDMFSQQVNDREHRQRKLTCLGEMLRAGNALRSS
ncbi:MAG: hypothetical protein ACREEE_14705, partial [Dongiaceae bacterium]